MKQNPHIGSDFETTLNREMKRDPKRRGFIAEMREKLTIIRRLGETVKPRNTLSSYLAQRLNDPAFLTAFGAERKKIKSFRQSAGKRKRLRRKTA